MGKESSCISLHHMFRTSMTKPLRRSLIRTIPLIPYKSSRTFAFHAKAISQLVGRSSCISIKSSKLTPDDLLRVEGDFSKKVRKREVQEFDPLSTTGWLGARPNRLTGITKGKAGTPSMRSSQRLINFKENEDWRRTVWSEFQWYWPILLTQSLAREL